jgi:hypothetical protein
MPSAANTNSAAGRGPDVLGAGEERRKTFCVILDEIRSDVETPESFAIKFSLLTKTPVSKMKHIASRLPATVWSGEGQSRARHILALIEEAGAKGRIVESAVNAVVANPPKETASKRACSWCGFPMKEGDTRCEFCMTPVGEAGKTEVPHENRKARRSIPPKRLLCYLIILIAGIVISLATR